LLHSLFDATVLSSNSNSKSRESQLANPPFSSPMESPMLVRPTPFLEI
jgi:hypothetical protein